MSLAESFWHKRTDPTHISKDSLHTHTWGSGVDMGFDKTSLPIGELCSLEGTERTLNVKRGPNSTNTQKRGASARYSLRIYRKTMTDFKRIFLAML